MKTLLIGLALFLSLSLLNLARATGPEYFSSRDSIKENAHSSPPSAKIIYVGVIPPKGGYQFFQVPYRKNLKIEELIAMTSFKGSDAGILVLRAKKPIDPVFRDGVRPGAKVNFILQPDDVVWVVDPTAPYS
jgi:hypothetical protein